MEKDPMKMHEYANIADKAGLKYYDSILLVSKDPQLNEIFASKFNDLMIINDLHEIEGFKTAKFDRIVVLSQNFSLASILQYLPKYSLHTNNTLLFCDMSKVSGADFQKILKCSSWGDLKDRDVHYAWSHVSFWREKWEHGHNLLVMV